MNEEIKPDNLVKDLCAQVTEQAYAILKNKKANEQKEAIDKLCRLIQSAALFAFMPEMVAVADRLRENACDSQKLEVLLGQVLQAAKDLKSREVPAREFCEAGQKLLLLTADNGTLALDAALAESIEEGEEKKAITVPAVDLAPRDDRVFVVYAKIKDKKIALFTALRPRLLAAGKVKEKVVLFDASPFKEN